MAALSTPNSAPGQEAGPSSQSTGRSSSNQERSSQIVAINMVKLYKDPDPHLQLDCVVLNSLTGEDLRHATADLWLEGKDSSDNRRGLWNFSLFNDGSPQAVKGEGKGDARFLKLSYAGVVVSGVDQIPAERPANVKDSIRYLAAYR